MSILNNVKLLLELDLADTKEDALIELYIKRSNDFIINYCKVDKVPHILQSTVEEMATFSYRQKGVENIDNESKGSLKEQFLTRYPNNIMTILNDYKRELERQKNYAVKFI